MQASWWADRRFGISIEASLASVPSWAPLGDDPSHYAAMIGEPSATGDIGPLPEVLAHHRDRWGHVDEYDDFAELLTFHEFDPERWAEVARDAGAGFVVVTGRHHDGWDWWDAPGSSRRVVDRGPKRNVIAELAAAFERNSLPFGAFISLGAVAPDRASIEAVHADAVDLVERCGVTGLWATAAEGPHDEWRGAEFLERLRAIEPGIVINNGWLAPLDQSSESSPIVVTHAGHIPTGPIEDPWEFVCGLGRSLGHNRAEPHTDLLAAAGIIARYTEVIAKGGTLRLSIGVDADGTIPDDVAARLAAAGTWIQRFAPIIEPCRPWTTWGDHSVRYLDAGDALVVIDLDSTGTFPALGADHAPVIDVELVDPTGAAADVRPVWTQHSDGLLIAGRPAGPSTPGEPTVYRVTLGQPTEPIALFRLDHPEPTPLAPLLVGASPGDIVQLGEGEYAGPATVPAGVILRGLGVGRTQIVTPDPDGIAPPPPAVTLVRHARLEHATVVGDATADAARRRPPVRIEAPFATVLGCHIEGAIDVAADDAIIRATHVHAVTAQQVERLLVSRCTFAGDNIRTAIRIVGGSDHEIESCRISDHRSGVVLDQAVGCAIRGNLIDADTFGIRAHHTERLHVHGNQIRNTTRAADIDGGSDAVVDGNSVSHSDSGCLVRGGATGVVVAGNHWHACRAGLITWSADPIHRDNICVELIDPDAAVVSGP